MATKRPHSGEVIDVRPLGPALGNAKTAALFKADGMEVIRLVLRQGKEIPTHSAPGPITVHCLEGRINFTTPDGMRELAAGQLLYLTSEEPHSLVGLEDSSVLVTLWLAR